MQPAAASDPERKNGRQRRGLRTRPGIQNRDGAAEPGSGQSGASKKLVTPGRDAPSQERAVDEDRGNRRGENRTKREHGGRTDHGSRESATQKGHEPMQRSGAPSLCVAN